MENILFLSHYPSQEKSGAKFGYLTTHLSASICRLANPQKAKMWDSEPKAGKSCEKWVKSSEMSQISKWTDF